MKGPLGELEEDLELCRRWFDPVAQGQRLRREIAALHSIPSDVQVPGEPLTFAVDKDKYLVTPEGRCAIDLFQRISSDAGSYLITDGQLLSYDRILLELYLKWSRHRIRSVTKLLAGEAKPLQLPAAAVVLALLINRSTSESRALKRFPAGSARDVIDEAFFSAVEAFSVSLAPKQRATRDPRLVSGWMLYEARRRLGDDVLIMEESRPETEARLWIDEAKDDEALDIVARDLNRGNRMRITSEGLAEAFDRLVGAFRSKLPQLAGFGLAHERPVNTRRVRARLLDKFNQYVEQ